MRDTFGNCNFFRTAQTTILTNAPPGNTCEGRRCGDEEKGYENENGGRKGKGGEKGCGNVREVDVDRLRATPRQQGAVLEGTY